jgi:hypothetical protein
MPKQYHSVYPKMYLKMLVYNHSTTRELWPQAFLDHIHCPNQQATSRGVGLDQTLYTDCLLFDVGKMCKNRRCPKILLNCILMAHQSKPLWELFLTGGNSIFFWCATSTYPKEGPAKTQRNPSWNVQLHPPLDKHKHVRKRPQINIFWSMSEQFSG